MVLGEVEDKLRAGDVFIEGKNSKYTWRVTGLARCFNSLL